MHTIPALATLTFTLTILTTLTNADPAAATRPQTTTLCNPAAIPTSSFNLAAFNPTTKETSGLTITQVSRGANILVGTPDGSFDSATAFTYDPSTRSLCVDGVGCDDGSLTVPLLFGSPGPDDGGNGGITLQPGVECFTGPKQTPLFVLGGVNGEGTGTTQSEDWAGWVFCGRGVVTGVYWNNGTAPDVGCEEVGIQVYEV